jgi:hypothetical protein
LKTVTENIPRENWAARSQAVRSNSWSMKSILSANISVAAPPRLPVRVELQFKRQLASES